MTGLRAFARWLPERVTTTLVRFGARRPRTVLTVALVLLVAALISVVDLRVEMDVLSLMPEHNRAVAEFQDTLERFGTLDVLALAIEIGDLEQEMAIEYADRLVTELRDSDSFHWVEYRQEDLFAYVAELLPYSTLFLTDSELDRLRSRLDAEGLEEAAFTLAARLRSPSGLALRELYLRDPIGILGLVQDRLVPQTASERFSDSGYLIDPDGELLLILAKPVRPAADLGFSQALLDEVEGLRQQVDVEWAEAMALPQPPTLLVGGGYAIAVADSRQVTRDMVVGAVSALVGVGLLFVLAFRRPLSALLAFTPLLFGLVYTGAFAKIAFGRLNATTSIIAAMLIGLGIDFVIVLYGRYLEERSDGLDADAALEKIAHRTAVAVLIGASTTAVTMLAFLVADFRGLVELGILAGVGILIVATSVFALLPALLRLFDHVDYAGAPRAPLRAFGLDRLALLGQRWPRGVLASVAVLTVVFALFAPQVHYNDDALNLRSPNNPTSRIQQRIMDAFGMRFTPYIVRIDETDESAALETARALLPELQRFVEQGDLARVESIFQLLPSRARQLEVIETIQSWQIDPTVLSSEIAAALAGAGLAPGPFEEGIDAAVRAVSIEQPLELSTLAQGALQPVVSRYWARTDDGVALLIYTYAPPDDRWRKEPPPELVELTAAQPNATLTGPVVVSRELKTVVRRDALLSASLGVAIVFLMLAASFGSWRSGLVALIPLAVGLPWMLGIMSLFDIEVNFLNLFVFTMLVGIAVDYGVHLMHRSLETPTHVGLRDTARAVVVAALTTVLGFGSLSLSHFPGLRSMGLVAVVGALSVATVAILVIPAVLTVLRRP